MTTVAILPEPAESGTESYRAISDDKESHGKTIGEALDRLNDKLAAKESGTVVILQRFQPDEYFDFDQQGRLSELMRQRRTAQARGKKFSKSLAAELQKLVEEELRGSARRAKEILRKTKK